MVESIGAAFIQEAEVQYSQVLSGQSQQVNDELDARVDERVLELMRANQALSAEIKRREHLEEELRAVLAKEKELHKLTTHFISLVSHEFRTPLTSIQSSTELLQYYSTRFTPEKKAEILDRIYASVQQMTGVLNSVLTIDQLGAGKLQFQPEAFFLTDFCRNLVADFQALPTGGVKQNFIFNCPADYGCVQLDKKLIGQILSHLLSNSLKFSRQPGTIEVNLIYQPGEAVFIIKDQGIGIPPQDQAGLFKVFSRGSNVSNIQGAGLGLTIVKHCVELHNGTINFESVEGQGTTFTVRLPMNRN
jgi:signal transduction histidine kinase